MNNYRKYFIIFVLTFLFGSPLICNAIEKIFYMSQEKETEGIASLQKNADKIDILAPQFYTISSKMKLVGKLSPSLKEIISQKNLKVMPLVTNYGFNQSIVHNLLTSPKDQDAIIAGFIYVAKKNNYIGWQFDFENINYSDKDLYSEFVEKTAKALRENDFILSVAAVSRSVDYEDTDFFKNWSGVFDYVRLSNAVDFISLMTYDDPKSVGPVASTPFVNEVLSYVGNKIPPEKLSLGIPLYNWGWRTDQSERVVSNGTHNDLSYIRSNFDHDLDFDSALGASCLTYFWQNKEYQIWYQDEQSFKSRLDIVEKNNFRGFSAWVLGIEDPSIWNLLNKDYQLSDLQFNAGFYFKLIRGLIGSILAKT